MCVRIAPGILILYDMICNRDGCFNEVKTRRAIYCSRSCAAKVNNLNRVRNPKNPENYCICGNRKSKKAKLCKNCIDENKDKLTINDVLLKHEKRTAHKYVQVRRHARQVMLNNNIKKTCKLCQSNEFDDVVEVCHIKGVTTFSLETLLNVVNDINNLVYLCPSHHKMFDKGLIDIN